MAVNGVNHVNLKDVYELVCTRSTNAVFPAEYTLDPCTCMYLYLMYLPIYGMCMVNQVTFTLTFTLPDNWSHTQSGF